MGGGVGLQVMERFGDCLGAHVWDSSVMMSRLFRFGSVGVGGGLGDVRGKDVLELGGGVGLTAVAVKGMGARRVEVTEDFGKKGVEEILIYNCQGTGVTVKHCRWGEGGEGEGGACWDLVIAADVLYDRGAWENLASEALRKCKAGGTFLVGQKDRGGQRDVVEGFAQTAVGMGWTWGGRKRGGWEGDFVWFVK
ncbi:hypothetical protein TrCOL_g6635 [Triparma columacea]|uniref:Uncharacterized protein n=1 Tax=Triparma columacea TaxID=722753 RepID=A0A9W7GHF6_9STRA|nr:hypothetical protein TrCOL_g6635 [Triparma columacea]